MFLSRKVKHEEDHNVPINLPPDEPKPTKARKNKQKKLQIAEDRLTEEKKKHVIEVSRSVLQAEGPMPITALASRFFQHNPNSMPITAYLGKGNKYAKFLTQHSDVFGVNMDAQTVWLVNQKDEEQDNEEPVTLRIDGLPREWTLVNIYFLFQVFGYMTNISKKKDETTGFITFENFSQAVSASIKMNGAVIHGFSAPIQVQILQRKENARRHSEIEEEQVEEEPPQKRMKQEPTEEQIEIQEPVEEPNTNVVREMLQYKLRMAQNAGNQEEVSKIELKLASL